MPGESARSLRKAVIAVGALGALSLSVPASLWLSPGRLFPTLHPVSQIVQARVVDDHGRPVDTPARLRPGSSTTVVVTGFDPGELILLRGSAAATTLPGGRADQDGVFRYRLSVPASMAGAHFLTVIGASDDSRLAGWQRSAVFRYVVSVDQAGNR
jgi:hypothetical protein